LKVTSDSARAARFASRQNIQLDALREVQFKFPGILVGRHIREAGSTICGANSLEGLRRNRDAYGRYRELRRVEDQGCGEFRVGEPFSDCRSCQAVPSAEKLFSAALTTRAIRGAETANQRCQLIRSWRSTHRRLFAYFDVGEVFEG